MVRATLNKRKMALAESDTNAKAVKMINGGDTGRGKKRKAVENLANPKAVKGVKAPPPAAAPDQQPPKKKRGRIPNAAKPDKDAAFVKLTFRTTGEKGVVLTLGQGDTGQLGLGEDILDRTKPAHVKSLEGVVDICAGGMHSVCLTAEGQVYTFGCNDEGSLGRITEDDDECFTPGKVNIPGKVVQISAGDSHTVALTEDGKAFYWGTFRDGSGSFGLTSNGLEKTPVPLAHHLRVKKVASGSDHVALLTTDGELHTVGTAEQGQLGRVGERFVARGGRRGLGLLLHPDRVHAKNRRIVFKDVWAGSYSTYALTQDDDVLVCGLNNYNQLGVPKGQLFFTLVKSAPFSRIARESGWKSIAPGQHHAICLDNRKRAYTVGRVEYGRLGLGENTKADAIEPSPIGGLDDVVDISCGTGEDGTAVSFAVRESGEVLSWGMGTNGQLGHSDDDDAWAPEKMMGKNLEARNGLLVAGGGQHTILLAKDK